MPYPRAVSVMLSDEEREQLEAWARRRKSAQALAMRSRVVLAAAEGLKNTEIGERLGITRGMAAKWRRRFVAERLDGLVDALAGGRARAQPVGGAAHLAGLWPPAAPPGHLEALQGPSVRRQGARRRGALSGPARGRGGPL